MTFKPYVLVLPSMFICETYCLLIFVYFQSSYLLFMEALTTAEKNLQIFVSTSLTNELCDRVMFSLCADCSCNAVILQDGQEELNKV